MSLAVLADHMASKGRGPDSMLIHMSPREVQGLQALAMKHGGSLTINPDTGLPEAGFLDKLLPTIIGAGLTLAGVPPNVSAMIVGGIQTVRTGDIGKGIQAGLGAYGGANLTSSMTAAGSSAIGSEAAALGAGIPADMAYNLTDAGVQNLANVDTASQAIDQARTAFDPSSASPYEKLSRGFDSTVDQFKNNPMQALKTNAKDLAYAFGPAVLAEMNVKQNMPKTVTKPGMITPYSYFGGQYVAGNPYEAAPTKSAQGGLMGLAAGGMAGYGDGDDVPRRTNDNMAQGGLYDFAQRSEPVVRMADGGVAHYAGTAGSLVKDASGMAQADINAALAAELAARGGTSQADLTNYAKTAYNLSDAQINAAYDTIPGFNAQGKYDAADYIATSKPGQVSPQMVVDAANAANPYSAQNMANVDITRPGAYVTDPSTGKYVALTPGTAGYDINNPMALQTYGELATRGTPDSSLQAFNAIATPAQKAEADRLWAAEKARLDALDAAKAPTGLAALNQTQNVQTNQGAGLAALANLPSDASYTNQWFAQRGLGFDPIDRSIDNFLATYKTQLASMTPKQQEDTLRAALNTERMNEADVVKATGMTIAQLIQAKRADGSIIVPGNLNEVPVGSLPGGVSGAGNTVVNANGTITTTPNIPGRPEDGFTGMTDVRNAYTKGGGSLGYIPYAPKTIEEFNAKYVSPLKGGTKQAYDYLSGKADYNPIPYTKDGQIAKSYAESVMKMPVASSSKMYIFKDGKFVPNPDYAIPTYDSKGVKTASITNKEVADYVASKPADIDFYNWMKARNLSPEQVALASGLPINEISKRFSNVAKITDDSGNIDTSKQQLEEAANFDSAAYLRDNPDVQAELDKGIANFGDKSDLAAAAWNHYTTYGKNQGRAYTKKAAYGGLMAMARGGSAQFNLGDYSDGGRLLRGPGDGVSDSIPASIGNKRPARLADGEFVVPARIVSELGNGSTEAGARKLYAMMDRVQAARRGTVGKGRVAKNSRADKYLPA